MGPRPSLAARRFWPALYCLVSAGARAAEDTNSAEIPPLRPIRPEIPAGFWEQNGNWVLAGAAAVLVVVALLIWRLSRTKPAPPVAPVDEARTVLEPLSRQPEDGRVLSRVSHAVRRLSSAWTCARRSPIRAYSRCS